MTIIQLSVFMPFRYYDSERMGIPTIGALVTTELSFSVICLDFFCMHTNTQIAIEKNT